jgi:hypothetical protein
VLEPPDDAALSVVRGGRTGGGLMAGRAVLRLGDRVQFDGGEHYVLGLLGTSVRLRGDDGAEQVVLAGIAAAF